MERVRRATGRGEKAFATPAAFRAGTRVLVHLVEGELGDPIQVELWDSAGNPRRLASVVLRSPVWGEHAIRADGRLAASFGCRLAASGRICSEGQLVVLDDTDKKPRVAAVGYDLDDWIRSIAVMPHEPLVLSGGCGKYDYQNCLYGELRAWQAESDGEKPRGYEPVRTFGGALESIALSADGKAMGLTSQRGKVALMRLDAARGEAAWLASPLEAKFERLRADPQPALKCGKQVVSNPILARASAQLQATDALCAALEVFPPSPDRTALDQRVLPAASASGTRLALNGCATWKGGANVCEGERTTVWSIVDRRLAQLIAIDTPNTVTALAFAPDGTHLALATCSETRAADCEDGKLELIALNQEGYPRRTLVERAGLITAIAFRPGFDALAYSTCARLEDTGAVRDCALGAIRRLGFGPAAGGDATLTAHRGTMSVLAYSADGTLLVSGGTDGSVALWDAKQGERLGPVVPAHSQPVAAIRFESADAFVSSTEHDEIEWHASPGRWKSVACRIANRRLTAGEHMRFLGPRETVRDPCESAASTQGSPFLRWARGLIGSER